MHLDRAGSLKNDMHQNLTRLGGLSAHELNLHWRRAKAVTALLLNSGSDRGNRS